MKKKLFLFIALLGGVTISLKAQQLQLYSLYNVNKYEINSAFAGLDKCTEAYLDHRSQWVGIDGAPVTSSLAIHTGVGKNIGLGMNLRLDQATINSNFSGLFTFVYRVKITDDQRLGFGLSGGLNQMSINPSSTIVDDITDEIYVAGKRSSMAFKNEFSVLYNFKKLDIGFSVPQIFETNAKYSVLTYDGNYSLKRHMVGYVGYDQALGDKWSIQPSVLYKNYHTQLSQFDINAQMTYMEAYSLGVGYRTNSGILCRVGITIKEKFKLAYAYEFVSNNISQYSGGSHEIMLGVKFCKPKEAPRSSFESSEVVTPMEIDEDKQKDEEKDKEEKAVDIKEEVIEPEAVEDVQPIMEEDPSMEIDETKPFLVIQFPLNEMVLTPEDEKILDEMIQILHNQKDVKFSIVGHSCGMGSESIKQKVSDNRAEVIKDYLVKKGVPADRIETKGVSDKQNKHSNDTISERQKNRIGEVYLKKG